MALNESSVPVIDSLADHTTVTRPSANFNPSIWGDFFLAYEAMEPFPEKEERELERLKEEIKMLLKKTPAGSYLKLEFIDNIQRLGVSYQFEDEIEASLSNIYNSCDASLQEQTQNNLHNVALRFRLLRQQGHNVSSEALKKFQNQEGDFEASLASDVRGLLSLYEATRYRVHGEDILEKALNFTTIALERMMNNSSAFIAKQINLALTWPTRKSPNRVIAREYIPLYEQDESHDEILLKFAKMDFNRVQRLHQKELCALTQWWKGMDCARNFPFVRDRLVENYFIMNAVYFEPEYSLARIILNKVMNMLTIIDDIYDTYGTIDKLVLFTDAIQRWNIDAANQLPPYMKLAYQFLLDVYTEMEEKLAKHGWSDRVQYAKEKIKEIGRLSYQEAYWNHTNYMPTMEEFKERAPGSTGISMLVTNSYMGMGDMVTKEVLEWAAREPFIVRATSTISRFTDDINDHEETKHVTAVVCYLNQYGGTREEAVDELRKQISNAWKDLNRECLFPTGAPMPIIERVLNLAKMLFATFRYETDGYTHSKTKTKELITSLFVDPII